MMNVSNAKIYQYIEERLGDWEDEDSLAGQDEEFLIEKVKAQLKKVEEMLGFGESPNSDKGETTNEELKACPFCGGAQNIRMKFYPPRRVCDKCGAEGPAAENNIDAYAAWNYRHGSS